MWNYSYLRICIPRTRLWSEPGLNLLWVLVTWPSLFINASDVIVTPSTCWWKLVCVQSNVLLQDKIILYKCHTTEWEIFTSIIQICLSLGPHDHHLQFYLVALWDLLIFISTHFRELNLLKHIPIRIPWWQCLQKTVKAIQPTNVSKIPKSSHCPTPVNHPSLSTLKKIPSKYMFLTLIPILM